MNGPQQSDQTPSSVPVTLPDVFVRSVLSGHSAARATAAGVIYSVPSLPSQATIDQSHDLIPSLCAAVGHTSIFPQRVTSAAAGLLMSL